MPCTRRYHTAIIPNGRVKMDALFLVAIFIIDNFYKFTTQQQYILIAIWMSMNGNSGSWQQCIQENERLTDIYAASTSRPLIAHQPIAYLTMASLMLSTIYFTSSSVTYGPAGRQKPTLNSASSTPFVYTGAPSYTGCLCIGFHTGRHSIFFPSMNTRNASIFSFG